MRAHGAGPRVAPGVAADSTGDRQSLAQRGLPASILERLAAEGVRDLADWRALGRRRFELWGITSRMVRELDAAARKAHP